MQFSSAGSSCSVVERDQADLPVLVVIGRSGVGKSTLLNYLGGLQENDLCYFNTGESSSGITERTEAKKIRWRGTGSQFIVVDTPGLNDPQDRDKEIASDIVTFIRDRFQHRKITLFLFLHKYEDVRFNFKTLKMYHYMFGDIFWDHLMIEITWWSHDPDSERRRLMRRRQGMHTRESTTTKLIEYIKSQTRIPADHTLPFVFIDPIYDKDYYQEFIQYFDLSQQRNIEHKQNLEQEKVRQKLFFGSDDGFSCSDNCKSVVPSQTQGPIIMDHLESVTKSEGTLLTLSCIVPIPLDGQSEQCNDNCKSGWTINGTIVENKYLEIKEHSSGYMKLINLNIGALSKNKHQGSYQCVSKHCTNTGECASIESDVKIAVNIRRTSPKIKVFDKYVSKFHCKQELLQDDTVDKIRFSIKRINRRTGNTFTLQENDFESFHTEKTVGSYEGIFDNRYQSFEVSS